MKDDFKEHIKDKTLEDDKTSISDSKKKIYEIFLNVIMR